jgi:putative nucleotidyltransferase with HDIG domain
MTYKILIVDDEPANLRLLERLFRRDYSVLTASSGQEALRLLGQHDVALLVTDQRMPGMTGTELLKQIADTRPHMVRMILTGYTDVGALVEAINCGQVYRYVTKPWDNDDLRLTIARALEHYETNKSHHELEVANGRLSLRLREMTQGFVRAIADALEARNPFVYGHARRVGGYAGAIGRRMHLGVESLEKLALAALLHDVGKIGTPDSVLLKPSALTEDERAVVRLHAERGARMLAGQPEMEEVAAAVRHHHENYDGTGYPEGLAGEQIPVASRIIRVADAYDAMTSERPFRDALSHEAAVAELVKQAGTLFDPLVVGAFCKLEALSQIRRHIGPQFLPVARPANLRGLTPHELLREVEAEPALAARVLRAANVGRPAEGQTASLKAACERLGADTVRHVVAQADVCERVCYESQVLRIHSRRCAVAARLLAEKTGLLDPEAAYTAGLLHDVGEVLLHALFPQEMETIAWLDDAGARVGKEVTSFGVDHAQVGQWILEACGVPREVALSVQTHHDAVSTNDPAALLLHVADAVAHAHDSSEVTGLDACGSDRLALLRLTRSDLARIHEQTNEEAGERLDQVPA